MPPLLRSKPPCSRRKPFPLVNLALLLLSYHGAVIGYGVGEDDSSIVALRIRGAVVSFSLKPLHATPGLDEEVHIVHVHDLAQGVGVAAEDVYLCNLDDIPANTLLPSSGKGITSCR